MTNKEQLLALTKKLNGYGCNYTQKDWKWRCDGKWLNSQIDATKHQVTNTFNGVVVYADGFSAWLVDQIHNLEFWLHPVICAGKPSAKNIRLFDMFRYMLRFYDYETYMRIID